MKLKLTLMILLTLTLTGKQLLTQNAEMMFKQLKQTHKGTYNYFISLSPKTQKLIVNYNEMSLVEGEQGRIYYEFCKITREDTGGVCTDPYQLSIEHINDYVGNYKRRKGMYPNISDIVLTIGNQDKFIEALELEVATLPIIKTTEHYNIANKSGKYTNFDVFVTVVKPNVKVSIKSGTIRFSVDELFREVKIKHYKWSTYRVYWINNDSELMSATEK